MNIKDLYIGKLVMDDNGIVVSVKSLTFNTSMEVIPVVEYPSLENIKSVQELIFSKLPITIKRNLGELVAIHPSNLQEIDPKKLFYIKN